MKIFICTFMLLCCFVGKAYCAEEDLPLMKITLPLDWVIAEATDSIVVAETEDKKAKFIYKKISVYSVKIEEYARALMKAYGGYNFQKRTDTIFYFEYFHGNKTAWTLVSLYKKNPNFVATQTGIGESEDFVEIMDSIRLK